MRTIQKRRPPPQLTTWRAHRQAAKDAAAMPDTYDALRREPVVLAAVEDGVFAEQGGLCAYTGRHISLKPADTTGQGREVDFHLEHLLAQEHCKADPSLQGRDTAYDNLVACWPEPNCKFEPQYGARKKGAWPTPGDFDRFVSPLDPTCSRRFAFNQQGAITPVQANDQAATETIKKLGLDHKDLEALRRDAIRGELQPRGRQLKLKEVRKLLRQFRRDAKQLDQGVAIQLKPFCFAIEQALEREMRKLEGILNSRRGKS